MRMVDIIEKKRDGRKLDEKEIRFFIEGYTKGTIPDYQASAFCMAILFQGMDREETAILTDAMMHSGEMIDLSSISGIKCDKHSTGGVGDKASLAVGPIVAACGAKLAKLSGRGLGHTGGTLDKLESIPGLTVSLSEEQFIKQVNDIGLAIIGQTAEIDPADKKMYALRDVTGTIPSIPLIASSIMSKKLAAGSDVILLDVKVGDGAFMKTKEDAEKLARAMVDIGTHLGRKVSAVLTDMDEPLGLAVGNALEVKEAIDTLNGKGPRDFRELIRLASAKILLSAGLYKTKEEALIQVEKVIQNGAALEKLCQMVSAQKGDASYIRHPEKFLLAKHIIPIYAKEKGYVAKIDAMEIGLSAMRLGAGRETMEDIIDPSAGILLEKKVGDRVEKGDVLAYAHTNKDGVEEILDDILSCFHLSSISLPEKPIILGEID